MIREVELEQRVRSRQHAYVEEIEDGLAFAKLRGEWNALHAKSDAGPFLAWDWLYPFWRRVVPEAAPRILIARDREGQLIGVLPMYEKVERVLGVPVRRWGMLGDKTVGSDYLEVLCEKGREQELTELFASTLVTKLSRIDVLELTDLPTDRPLLADTLAVRLAGRAIDVHRETLWDCPQVMVRSSFDEYLKSVGRTENLMRRKKWFRNQKGFEIEKAETPAMVAAALPDFFRLHRLRWEKDGGSQGIDSPEIRNFHRDAALMLAESGKLRLYTLRLGKQALASVYAIKDEKKLYYYQSGYDPEWMKRSPGLVILAEVIGDAFAEGKVGFDFLRGSEPYKFEWANGKRQIEALRFVNRSPGGAAYLAWRSGTKAVKQGVKKMVGEKVWELVKREKRSRTALTT